MNAITLRPMIFAAGLVCLGTGMSAAATMAVASTPPEVKTATEAPHAPSVATIYTGDKLRDPFMKTNGSTAVMGKPFSLEDFNIHNLALRGLMRDGRAEYALFLDSNLN